MRSTFTSARSTATLEETHAGVPGVLSFADGFETGNTCGWSQTVGGVGLPTCNAPTLSNTIATYTSDGRLMHLSRSGLPEQIFYFYFYGRPIAQLERSGSDVVRRIVTDHLGTPILLAEAGIGGIAWQGGFEPYGRDWKEGTSGSATGKNLLLRLPGQWEDESWREAAEGVGVFYNVHRWIQGSAGRYTAADPATLAWEVAPKPFHYAEARPTAYVDPVGLWILAPSCIDKNQQGSIPAFQMDPAEIASGIEAACKAGTTPGTPCYRVLKSVGTEAGKDLLKCFDRTCRPQVGPKLDCDPMCSKGCGVTEPGRTTLGSGRNYACPYGNGKGYGPTLFHETLHQCEFAGEPQITEPGAPSIRASRWRLIEWTCFRWRHPEAPARRPRKQ